MSAEVCRASGLSAMPEAGGATKVAFLLAVLLAMAVGVLSGCASKMPAPVLGWDDKAPAPEGYYRIKSGDTLSEVAEGLKLNLASLAQWNDLQPPYRIIAGGLLRIVPPAAGTQGAAVADRPPVEPKAGGAKPVVSQPTKKATAPAQQATPSTQTATKVRVEPGTRSTRAGLAWQWPLSGPVKRRFAPGDRTRSGIRIGGRPGAQVVAAAAGSVVYSGSGLKGYGNLIIVKHDKNYLSAYGFNRRLLVREGEQVKRGQAVAEVGQTGGDWLLHFEIRKDGTPVDPLGYLPKVR